MRSLVHAPGYDKAVARLFGDLTAGDNALAESLFTLASTALPTGNYHHQLGDLTLACRVSEQEILLLDLIA